MSTASRVRVVPVGPASESELVDAARNLAPTGKPVRPGDIVGGLVVIAVQPAPGASAKETTEWEILPAARRRDAPTVDVALLLDTSQSMSLPWDAKHTRLEAALASVSSFLGSAGPTIADVSIYHYAKEPRRVAGPKPAREIKLVPAASPKGRSHTGAALDGALADLAARTREDRSQVILLLTDGAGNANELRAAAARASHLSVPVHALVFAPEVDPLLQELADSSGGSVQPAAHPLTLEFVHQPGEP